VTRPKALLSWSTGKDSAFSLAVLREQAEVDVVGLVSTINAAADRVAMHGVRRELLLRQADAVGLPVHEVNIPWPCSNVQYEAAMSAVITAAREQGVSRMAFGDLFLADIRAYREAKLQGSGLEPMFPLWGRGTTTLAHDMLGAGIAAMISCVDTSQLAPAFAGRSFDHELLRDRCATCPRRPIPVGRTVNSTPSPGMARACVGRSRFVRGRPSIATASCSPICCPVRTLTSRVGGTDVGDAVAS
jgi:diphthamide synthase (EF-2-diphthine--ammonia ligase)